MKKSNLKFLFYPVLAFILLTGFVLPLRSKAAGECFSASGWGNEQINGNYVDIGLTSDGVAVYKNSANTYLYREIVTGTKYWFISTVQPYVFADTYFYKADTSALPSLVNWADATSAALGSGNKTGFTQVSCPGGSGNSTSTSISIDKSPEIYFYAFAIFLASFWIGKKL